MLINEGLKVMRMMSCNPISPKYPLVFVIGIAHSGSTLLGRLLDMHSRVLCVGEMMRIDEAMEKDYPCSCGEPVETCDFWRQHIALIQNASDLNYKRFTQELYGELKTVSGKDVIVDLSKTRVVRMMSGLFGGRKNRFKNAAFIILLRDPKGISASAMRRTEKPLDKFLSRYLKWMRRFQRLAEREGDRVHILKYEDLCQEPESEINRLCQFIGIDFQSGMMNPAEKIHHFIHSSTSGYMKNLNTLAVDERWRHELRKEDIDKIESVVNEVDLLRKAYAIK